jgi:dihydrofolate reductase
VARRVRYSVAASLDGYIAGPRGEFDWIPMDPDIDFPALFARFDTVLMGRASYDVARQSGHETMPGFTTYVFSRTLGPRDCPGAIVSATPAETVASLKQAPGKDIWLYGGGQLFRELLAAGLVDGVEIAVLPVFLGGGIPVLPAPAPRATLSLVAQRTYQKSGTVLLDYEVRG